jgi:hypothetical protein
MPQRKSVKYLATSLIDKLVKNYKYQIYNDLTLFL